MKCGESGESKIGELKRIGSEVSEKHNDGAHSQALIKVSLPDPVISESIRQNPLVGSPWIGATDRVPTSARTCRGLSSVLVLLLSLLVACSDSGVGPDDTDTTPTATPVVIAVVSGANQGGLEGAFLGEPVVVHVTDGEGHPFEEVPLRFSVIHGKGQLHADGVPQRTLEVRTNSQGLAQVSWKLGNLPDHVLKITISPETAGMATPFVGMPTYVFAGMDAVMSLLWTQGHEFRVESRGYSHDDRILETPHFLVFSDGSSDDAKVIFAAMAEEALHEILELFGISDVGEFGFQEAEPSTKLTIYSNKTLQQEQKAFAFRFGFIAAGRDTGVYPSTDRLRQVIKHELMHVFRMLVDSRWSVSQGSGHMWYLDSWFEEGLAEHVAGGSWYRIRTLSDMNAWRAQEDHTNPISIRDWDFFPASVIERSNGFEYYPMFDLAVRYLLDADGFGRDYSDVMAMFLEMELAGAGFFYAFEEHMGISAADYEDAFFDLMADYLPPQ